MLAPFSFMGGSIDAQALAHFNRVIADGGVIPAGLNGVNSFFSTIKSIYGTSNINTAVSAAYDPHYLGYKMGAGSGTTLGQAAQTLYSTSGASADVTQGTAANQPLLLTHTGENYWFGSGVDNNFVSTPNALANQITGDIDIIYRGNFQTNPTGNNVFIGKWDSGLISYYFGTNGAGNLRAGFNVGGSTLFANSSVAYATGVNWYRVTRSASTGVVTFFQSTQNTSDLSSVIWTQLGTTQSTTAGSLTSTTSTVSIFTSGSHTNIGTAYRATISNSIGGVPVVDFNPQQYTPSVSQTSWVSTTGETWSINVGTATTGYKSALVTKSIVQGDGIDDTMVTGLTLNIASNTRYAVLNPYVITSGYMISGALGGTGDRHLTYISGASVRAYSGSNFIAYTGVVASTLQLLQATFNAASSQVSRNNANNVTGTIDINNIDNLRIFSAAGSSFKNMNLNTLIETSSGIIDNSTTRTAMYNYLRSINNNAF